MVCRGTPVRQGGNLLEVSRPLWTAARMGRCQFVGGADPRGRFSGGGYGGSGPMRRVGLLFRGFPGQTADNRSVRDSIQEGTPCRQRFGRSQVPPSHRVATLPGGPGSELPAPIITELTCLPWRFPADSPKRQAVIAALKSNPASRGLRPATLLGAIPTCFRTPLNSGPTLAHGLGWVSSIDL